MYTPSTHQTHHLTGKYIVNTQERRLRAGFLSMVTCWNHYDLFEKDFFLFKNFLVFQDRASVALAVLELTL